MIKIILKRDQNIWFTSDTHYGHSNIVGGVSKWDKGRGTRDYKNVPEMNNSLISSINKHVKVDDILLHLGDWSFGGIDNIWNFRKQLHCKNIYLVLGNHDHHIRNNRVLENHEENVVAHDLFKGVFNYLELEIIIPVKGNLPNKRNSFVCFHYPIASWNRVGRGVTHLHGHIHTSSKNRVGPGRMLDVGVDGHPEFRPYSLKEVIKLTEKQPIKTLLIHKEDHHEKE